MNDERTPRLDAATLEALLASGRAREVVAACEGRAPLDGAIENLLGRALVAVGDRAGAERAFERAHLADPEDPRPLSNWGNLLAARGEIAEALTKLEAALGRKPDAPRTLVNYGLALSTAGRHVDAKEAFGRAARLDPSLVTATLGLSRAVREVDGSDASLALLEEAASRAPGSAILAAELGGALMSAGRLDEAQPLLERASAMAPDDAAIEATLGGCLRRRGELSLAIARLASALEKRPDEPRWRTSLGLALGEAGRAGEAVDELERAYELSGDPDIGSALLAAMLHDERQTARTLGAAHRAWGARVTSLTPGPSARPRRRARATKTRIGYVSGHFRTHVIMSFLSGVLAAHDRGRFDVHLVSSGAERDRVTEELRRSFSFHDLEDARADAFGDAIAALDLDVLVDLDGHTGSASETRLASLARKVARVQATYLGYPSTTGLGSFDYRITDAGCDPPGSEAEFSERLYRLPSCAWAFTPFAPIRATERVVRRPGEVVLGCFGRVEKIGDGTLAAWRSVLERAPRARLLLKARALRDEGVRRRIEGAFGSSVADRVELRPWTSTISEHYASYDEIDLALDTYPYNGTTTLCDALWMGVPTVTRTGDTSASRVGGALLRTAGLEHLVTTSLEAYVERASDLALDPSRLPSRVDVSERARSSPLGDPRRLARALEAAFEAMVEGAADIA